MYDDGFAVWMMLRTIPEEINQKKSGSIVKSKDILVKYAQEVLSEDVRIGFR